MRSSLCILCAILLLVFPVFTAIGESQEETDVWQQIFAALQKETAYTADDFLKGQIVRGNSEWAFSAVLREHSENSSGLFVGRIDMAGNLLSLWYPEEISLDQQMTDSLKSCYNRDDCYLRLSAAHEKWGPILQAMSEEELAAQIDEKTAAALSLDLRVPNEQSIAYEVAYDYALAHMAQQPRWSDELTHQYRLCISAYYVPADLERPVYMFYFEKHSYFEAAYETDEAMSQYKAKLQKLYGGPAPICFSVVVDAADGGLVENPVFDFAPIRFHFLDFLIRSDEYLQAARGDS